MCSLLGNEVLWSLQVVKSDVTTGGVARAKVRRVVSDRVNVIMYRWRWCVVER